MLPVEADLLYAPLLPRVPTAMFSHVRPYKPSDQVKYEYFLMHFNLPQMELHVKNPCNWPIQVTGSYSNLLCEL